ncbi:hypothetical protein JKP88DRAFT_226124 [Tribonema minus]|uniref:Uncharacterized protein n=1 Tax=Tribonema minus TaxID=303371 RepID=A0A835YPW1_9STRA|nr:hypothetical protein JKP88DRAFT_226124 [Tribonema minus]
MGDAPYAPAARYRPPYSTAVEDVEMLAAPGGGSGGGARRYSGSVMAPNGALLAPPLQPVLLLPGWSEPSPLARGSSGGGGGGGAVHRGSASYTAGSLGKDASSPWGGFSDSVRSGAATDSTASMTSWVSHSSGTGSAFALGQDSTFSVAAQDSVSPFTAAGGGGGGGGGSSSGSAQDRSQWAPPPPPHAEDQNWVSARGT